jgi:type IV secretion system protein VirD4
MTFCRLGLILAVALMAACTIFVGEMSPGFRVVAILLLIAGAAKKQFKRLTTLGSARWADVDDLRRAGMLGAGSGLILGRAAYGRRDVVQALKNLFDRRIDAETACRHFVELFHRPKLGLVRLSNAVHAAIFAPTGVGKGVSCVIPFLLTAKEACFVLDVKDGELARITAEARRKMGRKVYILDPYHCVTDTPATLNPVQFIEKNSPYALDDGRDIAAAIVERKEEKGDGVHFLDNAEAGIAAVIATVVEFGEGDEQRSLQAVCDIMGSPQRFEKAVKLMIDSAAQQGMLSRIGGNLTHLKERELASTMSTIARFLRFLSTPAIAASTRASTFDPNGILDGNTDVFCVLPADRVATLSPLLRLWTGTFLRAALRGNGQTKINFICDEAGSSLGKLVELEKALTVGRSAGIRLQLYYQDLGQLKKCWPDGADQTLLANVTQVFFGVNDPQTADFVSARLGDETIIVTSGGSSTGESVQTSAMGQPSTTRSRNWNENWQQQARRLLKPEEVANLSPRTAITFAPGMPPISTTLVRYYEGRLRPEGRWKKRSWSRAKLMADCVALLLMAVLVTGGVILFKEQRGSLHGPPAVLKTTKGE